MGELILGNYAVLQANEPQCCFLGTLQQVLTGPMAMEIQSHRLRLAAAAAAARGEAAQMQVVPASHMQLNLRLSASRQHERRWKAQAQHHWGCIGIRISITDTCMSKLQGSRTWLSRAHFKERAC